MLSAARRGIVLITTLLMMVLVVMMVTVVVYAGTGGLALTGNFYEREAALLAADSGLNYAMARLQSNSAWRGNDPDTAPAPRPDFSVLEKDGNVYGFLSTANGHRSQFRIKFNYEDGDGGLDGLDDTSDPNHVVISPLVSVNNLLGSAGMPVKRAKPSGYGVSSDDAPYEVPKATACLIVEGIAGWGMREADTTNPSRFESNRSVTRRVVEAYFTMDYSSMVDSAAYAAGTLDADLVDGGTFRVSSKDDDVNPRIRSLENVDLDTAGSRATGVIYDDGPQGEVVVNETSGSFTVDGTTPDDANVKQENSSSRFQKITWNAIAKASATSTTDAKMSAGTYVWRAGGGAPYLEYFDVEYTEGMALPNAGSGTRVDSNSITSSGSGVSVDSGGLAIMVANNVYVNESRNGAKGMAILTDPQLTQAGARPAVGFVPPEGSAKAPIVTSAGNIRLEGAVMGTGAITTEGDLTFQGPSILESDPETGVSLYAKGNINLTAIPDAAADKYEAFVNQVASTVNGGGTLDAVNYTGGTTGTTGGTPAPGGSGGSGGSGRRATPVPGPPLIPPGLARNVTTFVEKKQVQLQHFVDKFGRLDYADQNLSGVIYTWKNFNADLGTRGVLSVTGTVIAYGGNPEDPMNNRPGSVEGQGTIGIKASSVDLTYDSTYLKDLLAGGGSVKVKRTLWATY